MVADGIRARILSGRLTPGSHLVEADFTKEFDVSNGTVRAALRHLQNEELVEFRPRRGMFVATLTGDDVRQLCSLRDSLEALAAKEAALKGSKQDKLALDDIMRSMAEAVKAHDPRCSELDLAFHKQIVRMSGNRKLVKVYGLLESQIRLFMAMAEPTHSDLWADMIPLHAPIAEAILAEDASRAFELSSTHNQKDADALAARIGSNEQPASAEAG
jgi:DNA-binding GntR family transcriptional regulator